MKALLYTTAVAGVLAALCVLAIDQSFAKWISTRETYPDVWNTIIGYLEYPLGVEPNKWIGVYVLVAGAVLTLVVTPLRKYAHIWSLLALSHLLGRNMITWLKPPLGRWRPTEWLKHHASSDTFFHKAAYSFPSGHVILFASMIFPLALAYPKARPLLGVVLFAMVARVAVNAHFLGDVFGGLALSAIGTWACAVAVRRALPSQIRPPYLQ
ncbi:MAG TPA: phosphatase PAP2 family protein [Kofleriaceae bacterium]|nr:phosphatase PAP2 family protein [Kofleriaceae bacterium]